MDKKLELEILKLKKEIKKVHLESLQRDKELAEFILRSLGIDPKHFSIDFQKEKKNE